MMATPRANRSLPTGTVTFLFTDIEGSTRLWETHHDAMRTALARHDDILRKCITAQRGHVFKTGGDAFCAAFDNAPDALHAALAAQLALCTEAWPESNHIRVRMALHSGAAELRESDYFGPPLNQVARLLAVGHGGQTLLSETTYDLCRDRLPFGAALKSLGEHDLKDLTRRQAIFQLFHPDLPQAFPPLKTVFAQTDAEKPSIAVLAFTNLSGDAEQEYFADGIVDDIITALSRVRAFFVIARNSSFTYKGKAVDIKQVGRELGVRYVLEGSIRRAGNRVRITGQLIEAENGRHIWADRFEGDLNDIFDLQDRITESVVGAVEPSLRLAEIERARSKPTAKRIPGLFAPVAATFFAASHADRLCCAAAQMRVHCHSLARDRGQLWLVYGDDVDARGAGNDASGRRCAELRRRQRARFTPGRVHFRRDDHCHTNGNCRHGDNGDAENDARDRGFVALHI
jgi:adenylate cyclase